MRLIDKYIQEKLFVGKGFKSRRCARPEGTGPKYNFMDYLEEAGVMYVIDTDLNYMLKIGLRLNNHYKNEMEIPYILLNIKDDDYFKDFNKHAGFDQLYIYKISDNGQKIAMPVTTRYEADTKNKFDLNINGFKYTRKNAQLIYKFLIDNETNK